MYTDAKSSIQKDNNIVGEEKQILPSTVDMMFNMKKYLKKGLAHKLLVLDVKKY